MREPPIKVRLLGHPLVSLPVMGLCSFAIYLCVQNPDAWLLGAIAIIAGLFTGKAHTTMTDYRRWRRAWDSMPGPGAKRSNPQQLASAVIAVLVVGGFILCETGHLAMPANAIATIVGLAMIVLPLLAIAWLVKRLRAKARNAPVKIDPVRVVIQRPLLPVPSLEVAYRSLPEHSDKAMFG